MVKKVTEYVEIEPDATQVVDATVELTAVTDAIKTIKILPIDAYVIHASDEPQSQFVRVHIMRKFMLNRDNHTTQTFDPKGSNCGDPGYYDVTPEDAVHPYLIAHTDQAPPMQYPTDTLHYAEAQRIHQRSKMIQELTEKERNREADEAVRRQHLADLRERMGGDQSGLEDLGV